MKITELVFDNRQFGKRMQLVGVEPYFSYRDGKKTEDIEGYKYTVVLLEKEYEKLSVKVEGAKQIDIQEGEKVDIPIKFTDLEVGFFQNFENKNLFLKAKAKGIELVK